jgi:hypothetical protein
MHYDEVRDLLLRHTGGPNEAIASESYHDDALLDFPQSGERFQGKAEIRAWRDRYPARLDFEPREISGAGDLWFADGQLRYDGGDPVHYVMILRFRGGMVERETLYFAEPFAPPEERQPWAEEGTSEARGDLAALVHGGA